MRSIETISNTQRHDKNLEKLCGEARERGRFVLRLYRGMLIESE
jgi:hypothetical protein